MKSGPSRFVWRLWFVLASLAAGAHGRPATPAGDAGAREARPNVILVTISSLRADHVSSLGYARTTTPHLDRFAARGVLFRQAYATSGWTMPAHGSLFTSLYPSVHGATHIERQLDRSPDTLAEILAAHGYYCVGFCCGPWLDEEHGFAQGFHVYDDRGVVAQLHALEPDGAGAPDINRCRTNDLINDAVLSWLHHNRHVPFFLFVHYYDTHWDYLPPEPYRRLYDPNYTGPVDGTAVAREPLYSNPPRDRDVQHLVALYDGEVRQADEDLGQLLTALESQELLGNCLVVVLGDHGEEFYEHGHTSHQGLYDELIHVPLVIAAPRLAARSTEALVSQVDILPTILDYAGLAVPAACRGLSLRPVLEGRAARVREWIFCEYTGGAVADAFAVRSARYKVYLTNAGEVSAYDLARDPAEITPLVPDDFNGSLRQLQESLSGILRDIRQGSPPVAPRVESSGHRRSFLCGNVLFYSRLRARVGEKGNFSGKRRASRWQFLWEAPRNRPCRSVNEQSEFGAEVGNELPRKE